MHSALTDKKQTDEILMRRVQADDTEAFAQLYDRHARRALSVAQAICRDIGRAEDAVQEGFLAIWRSRKTYRAGDGSFQAWSLRIVQNRAIDSYRNAASRPPSQLREHEKKSPDADTSTVSVEDRVVAQSEGEALLASLQELPAAQAEVIGLAFFGELSHSEIAAQLDLPPGTVKGRMRLGLEKLRREMASGDERDS